MSKINDPYSSIEKASFDVIKAEFEGRLEKVFEIVGAKLQPNYLTRFKDEKLKKIVLEGLGERVKARQNTRQLASYIGRNMGNWDGPWFETAYTEIESLYNLSVMFGHLWQTKKRATEVNVARLGSRKCVDSKDENLCTDCNRLYINPLSGEPKIFKLSEILGNCNFGIEPKDWKPCIISTHIFCSCRVIIFYSGMIWNKDKDRFEYKYTGK